GDNVRRAFMRSDMIDNEDVWMIERTRGLSFLLKTGQTIFIGRERGRENFNRYVAPEFRISCAPNLAHASLANFRDDGVVRELRVRGIVCAYFWMCSRHVVIAAL